MSLSEKTLLSLQNGSDIRGVAIKGNQEINLNTANCAAIGASFERWLVKKTGKPSERIRIGVGHDSRLTARELTKAILCGVVSSDATGCDCGMASTPAMFMGTVFEESSFDGGIMVTASHLPFDRNGLKFFTRKGGLDKADIKEILLGAVKSPVNQCKNKAKEFDLMSLYTAHLRKKIIEGIGNDMPLVGTHIVVDAGNGAGGFFATEVLAPLGADITGSVFLEPDGTFPNHPPNPENKEAMKCISNITVKNKADLGLIFDTDVDRAGAVLPDGQEISKDALIAMLSALLKESVPTNSIIVTDSVTSDRLTDFLENELGFVHHCFKRGYKNVINEAKRLENEGKSAPLAIETSGHGALIENFFLDDGAYIAVKLTIACAKAKKEGKMLSSLIKALKPPFEQQEYRIIISADDFSSYGDEVLTRFKEKAINKGYNVSYKSFEGVRITFDAGWVVLRKSLHEPLLPLNLEGNKEGDCDKILGEVKELLDWCTHLDLSVLR